MTEIIQLPNEILDMILSYAINEQTARIIPLICTDFLNAYIYRIKYMKPALNLRGVSKLNQFHNNSHDVNQNDSDANKVVRDIDKTNNVILNDSNMNSDISSNNLTTSNNNINITNINTTTLDNNTTSNRTTLDSMDIMLQHKHNIKNHLHSYLTHKKIYTGKILSALLHHTETIIGHTSDIKYILKNVKDTNISKLIIKVQNVVNKKFESVIDTHEVYIPDNIIEFNMGAISPKLMFNETSKLKKLQLTSYKNTNPITLPNTIEHVELVFVHINVKNCTFENLKHFHLQTECERDLLDWEVHALTKASKFIGVHNTFSSNGNKHIDKYNPACETLFMNSCYLPDLCVTSPQVYNNLKSLSLWYNEILDYSISKLIPRFKKLEVLNIKYLCTDSDYTFPIVSDSLIYLGIGLRNHSNAKYSQKITVKCKNLETLEAKDCHIVDVCADNIKTIDLLYCILPTLEFNNVTLMRLAYCKIKQDRTNTNKNIYLNKLKTLIINNRIRVIYDVDDGFINDELCDLVVYMKDLLTDGDGKNEESDSRDDVNNEYSNNDMNNKEYPDNEISSTINQASDNRVNNKIFNNKISNTNNGTSKVNYENDNIPEDTNDSISISDIDSNITNTSIVNDFNNAENTQIFDSNIRDISVGGIKVHIPNVTKIIAPATYNTNIMFIVNRDVIDCTVTTNNLKVFDNVFKINYDNLRCGTFHVDKINDQQLDRFRNAKYLYLSTCDEDLNIRYYGDLYCFRNLEYITLCMCSDMQRIIPFLNECKKAKENYIDRV